MDKLKKMLESAELELRNIDYYVKFIDSIETRTLGIKMYPINGGSKIEVRGEVASDVLAIVKKVVESRKAKLQPMLNRLNTISDLLTANN